MLRASYDLAYSTSQPMNEAGFRKLRIRSKIPDLSFRHKTGYYARTSKLGDSHPLQLPVQRLSLNAQNLSRAAFVVIRRLKHLQDLLTLGILQALR